jgi:hypothetical protein
MQQSNRRKWHSILDIPEFKDFPLKDNLYSIATTQRTQRQSPIHKTFSTDIEATDQTIQLLTQNTPARPAKLSLLASMLKGKISNLLVKRASQPAQEVSVLPNRLSDIERVMMPRRSPKRKHVKLHSLSPRLTHSTMGTEHRMEQSHDTSQVKTEVGEFSFFNFHFTSDTYSQVNKPKRVREVVNLPKLPFGKHLDIKSPNFTKDFIRETETSDWFNVNSSKRRSRM